MPDNRTDEILRCGLSERRLAYLFEAVEAKSIRGAADKLDVEPSVVSRQIQILERELGTILLHRHGRGVTATEAARLVLDYYRNHRLNQATMLLQLEELEGLQRGNVHIATSEGFIEGLIETVLHDYMKKYPKVRVTLNAMPVSAIVRLVAEERVNIGLAYAPAPNDHVHVFARKRHPLYIIARHDHPITQQNIIPHLQALAGLPFCLVPEEFGIGQLTKLAEHATQVALTRAMETNSLQALRHYVTSGLGLAILPRILVKRELEAGVVKAIKIKNASLEAAEGQIIVPKRTIRSTAEDALLQDLTSLNWFT